MTKRELDVAELKQIQLDILQEVDSFCRKNNITYYLAYGTLLGAVRHGGYIPWDDDIDIIMPRTDYEIFKQTFCDANGDYRVKDYEIDQKFLYAIGKVEYKKSEVQEYVRHPSKLGVNIDVFVLDGIEYDDTKTIKKLYWLNNLYWLKQIIPTKERAASKNLVLIIGQILLKLLPLRKIIAKMINLSKYACEYSETEYVCVIIDAIKNNPIFKKSWFKPIEIEFEGYKFFAPENYHEILKGWYGDYMKLPPIEKQVTHHNFLAYVFEE